MATVGVKGLTDFPQLQNVITGTDYN